MAETRTTWRQLDRVIKVAHVSIRKDKGLIGDLEREREAGALPSVLARAFAGEL